MYEILFTVIFATICFGLSKFISKNTYINYFIGFLIFTAGMAVKNVYIKPYYLVHQSLAELKSQYPVFKTIEARWPNEYKQFVAQSEIAAREGDTNAINALARSFMDEVMSQSLPYASFESTYALLVTKYKLYNSVYSINPDALMPMIMPWRAPMQNAFLEVSKQIPQEIYKAVFAAVEKVIESGAKNKTPIELSADDEEELRANGQEMINILVEKYGKDAIEEAFISTEPLKDSKTSGAILLSSLEYFISKGEKQGAILYLMLSVLVSENQENSSSNSATAVTPEHQEHTFNQKFSVQMMGIYA